MEDKIIDLLSSEDLNLRSLGKNILIQNYKIPMYVYSTPLPSIYFYLKKHKNKQLFKMDTSTILLYIEKNQLYTNSEIKRFAECIYEYNK